MAYVQIPGEGMWWGIDPRYAQTAVSGFSLGLIDATGEKFAHVGRAWFKERAGTKAIRRVGFRFGAVTKAGGSALTVSLQDVNLAAGPPGQPDETQDQTVAIANADAGFASNVWYRTGALSADRTVTYGDPLAVVLEYDGAGRLGADAVNVNCCGMASGSPLVNSAVLKTGGAWAVAASNVTSNCVLEFSDGTFGCLGAGDALPVLTTANVAFNSASGADELALAFQVPVKCKIDALRALVALNNNASDFSLVLYQGTTALQTASVDANTVNAVLSSVRWVELPIPETELLPATQYYLSVKPTTGNTVTAQYFEVSDANHLACYPGGTDWNYATRADAGAWAAATTTRQLLAGVRVSSLDDGLSAGTTYFVPVE